MDPMDYSMDDASPTQPSSSNTPRCQYHAHQHPAEGSFASPSRDAHHYDPIHNTDSWYLESSAAGNAYARTLPSFGQWNPNQFVSSNAWQPLEDGHARLQGDLPDPAQSNAFAGVSNSAWNETHGYGSLPFGHSQFVNIHGRGTASAITTSTRNVAPNPNPPTTSGNPLGAQLGYPRNGRPEPPTQANPPAETRSNLLERSRAARLARAERREALQSQLALSFDALDHARPNLEDRSLARRRAAPSWESDEDEDHLASPDDTGYRQHSQLFGDQDDERALAAIRGTIAAAKKIPSKDALASLERVDLKDLKDADKVCTICYNDIGVENPDGVIENPIRLPRCKHIFGEKCIKKWFQDSDTCPYCRDKLPSELSVRKTAAIEGLRAHRERFAALTAQAYRARQQVLPARYSASEELLAQERNNVIRYTQEEYHYIMTGSHASESWSSYTAAHNRPAPHGGPPEARRRQGRGRVNLNRPMSIGSARFVAPGPPAMSTSQRAHLGGSTPNAPSSTPHRTGSPTPQGEASSPHNAAGLSFGRTAGYATTTEEPSPSVAVGSGVNPTEQRPPSLGPAHHPQAPYYDHSSDQWYEMFPSQSGRTSLPPIATYRPRPMDSTSLPPLFLEPGSDSFSASSASMTNSNYHPGHGNGSQGGTYGHLQHRWSGQFLN